MKSMNDLIYAHLLEQVRGLTNAEIVEHFFKMGNVESPMAERIVTPLLQGDRRFSWDGTVWRAVQLTSIEELPLRDAPYLLFAIDEIEPEVDRGRDVRARIDRYASFELFNRGDGGKAPPLSELLHACRDYIFLPYDVKTLGRLRKIYRTYSPMRLEMKTLSLRRLLSHFYPDKKYATWDDIIHDFSIVNFEGSGPRSRTKSMLHVFSHLIERASEQGVQNASELLEISNRIEPSINFSHYGFDRDFLKSLPERPGVYLFHNREGQVVYVGKTKNLKGRIGSYFRITGESEEKRELILQHLYSIEHRILGSDLEALIEEHRLIEKYNPLLNKQVKIPERRVQVPECVILLPSAQEDRLKLYFLTEGAPLLDLEYRPGVDISDSLRRVREGKGYYADPLKIIAMNHLKRYEEQLHVIFLDLYGVDEDLLRMLDQHWENRQNMGREKVTFI
jgi:hypothetical protein